MSVQVNVKRFSRDKRSEEALPTVEDEGVQEAAPEPIMEEAPRPKKRGRTKKAPVLEEPEPQPFDDAFLDDLKERPEPVVAAPDEPPALATPSPVPEEEEPAVDAVDEIFDYIEGRTPKPRKPAKKKPPKADFDVDDGIDIRSMVHNKPSRVAAPKTSKRAEAGGRYADAGRSYADAGRSYADPDFKDLMDKKGSAILGKDKRELLVKIAQYKQLFPDELSNFKVKQNASAEELQQYLDECDVIVGCSAMESFATDSILTGIQIVEGVSSRTQSMNISGTSQMLKANPQFHKLCKQLYLKYGVFSQIPPEMQLVMLISTTAMVARNKNIGMHSDLNSFLDQPMS